MARANGHYKILFPKLTGHCHLKWIWVNCNPLCCWVVGTLHLLLPRSWFTTNLVSSKVLWSLQKRWQDHILLLLANGAASISGCSPVAKINLVFLRPFKWSRPYQRTPSHWPGQSSTTTSTTHFDDRQRANVAGFVFPVFALISVSFLFSTLVFLCKFRCVFLPLYALCPALNGMVLPFYIRWHHLLVQPPPLVCLEEAISGSISSTAVHPFVRLHNAYKVTRRS